MATRRRPSDATPAGSAGSHPADPPPAADQLGKIRDLLFGEEARAHGERLQQLEARIVARIEALSVEHGKQITALGERLDREASERAGALRSLAGELKQIERGLTTVVDTLRNESRAARGEMEGRLEERRREIEGLVEDGRRRYAELAAAIEAGIDDLTAAKADRAQLSAAFMEIAGRLDATPKPPRR